MPFLLAAPALAAALASAATCANADPLSVQMLNADGNPLAGAVVGALAGGIRQTTSTATVRIVQRNRQFQPEISVIQTGTAVMLPNLDTVRHHVYSFSPIKRFEVKLYAGTPPAPVVFDKPGVAVLGCNIHDQMAAYVVVMDTPLFARADASGRVNLDLPPGEHSLQAWVPGGADDEAFHERTVTQVAGGQQLSWTVKTRAR